MRLVGVRGRLLPIGDDRSEVSGWELEPPAGEHCLP